MFEGMTTREVAVSSLRLYFRPVRDWRVWVVALVLSIVLASVQLWLDSRDP